MNQHNASTTTVSRSKNPRIALVIHPLHTHGGAEIHLKAVSDAYPTAPIFTAWSDPAIGEKFFPEREIITTWFGKLPIFLKRMSIFIPLQRRLYKGMHAKLQGFDKVFVLTDGFEKLAILPQEHGFVAQWVSKLFSRAGNTASVASRTKYIFDVLTPPRFLWMKTRSRKLSRNVFFKIYEKLLLNRLHKRWKEDDKAAVRRADKVFANSKAVQQRILKFYGVQSTVLYPPVSLIDTLQAIQRQPSEGRESFYLYFGRVESYKGVDLAIKACIQSGKNLKIAGTGKDEKRLRQLAANLLPSTEVTRNSAATRADHPQIEFLGFVDDKTRNELFATCKALIYPVKDEDFGLIPIEANAAGVPVIAYKGGGVAETVIDGKTGVFFDEYNENALESAIEKFENLSKSKKSQAIKPEDCRENAKRFSREKFLQRLSEVL